MTEAKLARSPWKSWRWSKVNWRVSPHPQLSPCLPTVEPEDRLRAVSGCAWKKVTKLADALLNGLYKNRSLAESASRGVNGS